MLTIHREKQPDRIIRMGHAPVVVAASLKRFQENLDEATVPDAPPEPVKSKQGRKKMADEKKLGHETGVKKISQEPADKQGPVGTSGEKPPAGGPSEDLTIGDKEGKDNA